MDYGRYKTILFGALLAGVLVAALATTKPPSQPLVHRTEAEGHSHVGEEKHDLLAEGDAAPDFVLPKREGGTLGARDLRGAYSALVFVTPTCPYCKKLKETLVQRALPGLEGRLVFITMGASERELPDELEQLESQVSDRFVILSDKSRDVGDTYKAAAVPTIYLLDGQGAIAGSGVGPIAGVKLVDELVDRSS